MAIGIVHLPWATCSLAAVTIESGIKPNLRCNSFNGADAPNVFMPIMRPRFPMYRSHPNADACSNELLVRLHSETDFTPRCDKNDFGIATGRVCKNVGATRDSGCRCVLFPIERRQWLARQHQHSRFVTQLHDVAVGFDNLVGVARSKSHEAWNRPQRCQMLYRLMSRTVFAVAHRVVCENKYGRQFHQSR